MFDELNEIIFVPLNSSVGHAFKIFIKVSGDNTEDRVTTFPGDTEYWVLIPWQKDQDSQKSPQIGYNKSSDLYPG